VVVTYRRYVRRCVYGIRLRGRYLRWSRSDHRCRSYGADLRAGVLGLLLALQLDRRLTEPRWMPRRQRHRLPSPPTKQRLPSAHPRHH
jgi:hypothetical protein